MLTEPRHLLPLDPTTTPIDSTPHPDGVTVPFGLRCAVAPADMVEVDLPTIGYDPDRQIAVITDGDVILPAMKHTSTQTKTSTASSDRKGNDSDTDSTGS